jgi:hypothetical protein
MFGLVLKELDLFSDIKTCWHEQDQFTTEEMFTYNATIFLE